jgi:aromatic-amino-acid transaminase
VSLVSQPAVDARSHLVPESQSRSGDDPIFALNAEAQRRAKSGESVVNATLGALMEDDGRLAVMPVVAEALAAVPPERGAAYAQIAGDPPFLQAVVRDLFGDGPLAAQSVGAATPGGTGALHHAIVNLLEPGHALLTPSFYWGPYKTIAQQTRRRVETFPMFDAAGRFDAGACGSALEKQVRQQGRALLIINSPCHNPTGYSLDDAEWQALAAATQGAAAHGPVTLCVDFAYARFAGSDPTSWVRHVQPLLGEVLLVTAWSASKAFAQYGARIGALVATHPDPAERERIQAALSFSCRGTWSNCNHLGMLAITELLRDPALRARADKERDRLRALLDGRVAAFNEAARKAGLRYPRYEGGFFVTVFVADAERSAARARERGVFVVPMQGAVRVALCSTPARDVPRLVQALVE